jgi:hypothetical protein
VTLNGIRRTRSARAAAATRAWLLGFASLALVGRADAITAPAAAPAAKAASTSGAPPASTAAAPAPANSTATGSGTVATSAPAANAAKPGLRELDWEELVPKDARSRFAATPPAPIHDYLGEGGMAAQQVMDFSVNKELDGATVKLPGFIVPLDVGKDGMVSEFFLVPYFGACIHVPPPPPNQIVYVRMTKAIALDSIYEAYWITGRMKVGTQSTKLGAAAYQLAATQVEIYKY